MWGFEVLTEKLSLYSRAGGTGLADQVTVKPMFSPT